MSELRPLRLRVCCHNLRHKMMYVDQRQDIRGLVDDNSDTRVYFCSKTHEVLGPDGDPVTPDHCQSGRGCHCHGPDPV